MFLKYRYDRLTHRKRVQDAEDLLEMLIDMQQTF